MHRGDLSRVCAAALALLALAAAGCGSSGGSSGATTGSGGRGGTLTIAEPVFPATLDTGLGESAYSDFNGLVFDPLIVQAPDGSFQPGLAVSWKYGPRNLSFSMKLRPNVKFSDGVPLDAQAVKTWIEYVKAFPGGYGEGYLSNLTSIEVTSPLSLTLHFSKPTPQLELTFSEVLQIGQVGSPKAVKAGTLKTDPVGAGPYLLDKAQTVARDHYTYVPNPTYWNKSAIHWSKIVLKVMTNPSSALDALRTGQVQAVVGQPVTSLDAAKAAGLKFVAPPTLVMALQLSDRNGKLLKPLGDVRVRQAINYAIDRQAVGKVVGGGYGQVTDQFAAIGDDAYDPALNDRYPYDPAKARALLAAAGYPNGFTLPVLSLNAVGQDLLAQTLAGQLAKVGIKVKPDIKSDGAEYSDQLAKQTYPAATLSWGRLPAVTNYQQLWGPLASAANPFKSEDPQLDAIYNQLVAAPPAKAGALARRMQQFLVEQAWFAPVVVTPLVVLYDNQVANVLASNGRSVTYANEWRPAS